LTVQLKYATVFHPKSPVEALPRMPKLGMEPIRRRQLIDATIVSIGRYGLADTTVQRISREAGVSSGIIHHYFGGKNELLEATMRRLLQRLHDDVVTALAPARTAEERLIAVIESNFAASQFQAGVISAWLAFWAEAPHVPALGRLQRLNVRRLHSNLMYSLRHLLPVERALQTARGLAALIDGLWLRAALDGSLDGTRAREIAIAYLRGQLPPPGEA
jgi:TetR/AcrR family transcriptional regulator, transcriptional repressor of bet genes